MFLHVVAWRVAVALVFLALLEDCRCQTAVQIFHFIDNPLWGETDGSALEGTFQCPSISGNSPSTPPTLFSSCTFISTDPKGIQGPQLMNNLAAKYNSQVASGSGSALTVGLYSIHSWAPVSKWPHYPDRCMLPTDVNIAESEESFSRFRRLFESAFPGFHGNSTTHPLSGALLQRSYVSEFKASEFLDVVPFERKIKGAAYVASTCHGYGRRRPMREVVVSKIERHFRVDSLGKCHRSANPLPPDAVKLTHSDKGTAAENLKLKQQAISKYLFYLAFENSVEPGYVTEKVFDALKAGTVPIYLGPKEDCRKFIPFEKAVIFVEDYLPSSGGSPDGGVDRLALLLEELSSNQTLYEEHLQWRDGFSADQITSPLLKVPWPCRVCSWAATYARDNQISPGSAARDKQRICRNL